MKPPKTFTGNQHRKYRHDIATAMRVLRAQRDNKPVRPPDSISRALIFPLSGPGIQSLDFADFAADYNVIEGVGHGTLFHYLVTLLSNGFRLSDSASSAVATEQSVIYAAATDAIRAATGDAWPAFTFEAIVKRLSAQPRVTAGKSVEFAADLVSLEWCKTLYGHGDLSKVDAEVKARLSSLSSWLADRFDSWKALQSDRSVALRAISEWITHDFRCSAPDLAAINESLPKRPKSIQSAPIAFVSAPQLQGEPGYALHRVVAQLLHEAALQGVAFEKAGAVVVDNVVTQNNSALSWIFGVGLAYFAITNPSQVAEDFRVPAGKLMCVEAVCEAARAVRKPRLFGLDHYASYRSLAGGKISSWTSNYINRLATWRSAIAAQPVDPFMLPAVLATAAAARVFDGLDVDYARLCTHLGDLHALGTSIRDEVLARVTGERLGITDADFDAIERYIELQTYVSSRLNILANRIEQEIRLAQQALDGDRESLMIKCRYYSIGKVSEDGQIEVQAKFPAWMTPLDVNLGISGGVPDVRLELEVLADRFNGLMDARREHVDRINSWLRDHGHHYDPTHALAEDETKKLERAGRKPAEGSPIERARRRILSMFLHQVRLCPDGVRRRVIDSLVETQVIDRSLINLFMFNGKQIDVYVSVFARTRHSACDMNSDVLNKKDWLDWIDGHVRDVWSLAHKHINRDLIDAAVRLDRVAAAIRMRGLPDVEYPIDVARLAPATGDINLPLPVHIQLTKDTVRADTLARIINAYYSALNATTAKLIRPSFIVRARFQRVGNNALHYVPRDRAWQAPEGWVASGATSPLSALARERLGLSPEHRTVNVVEAFSQVLKETPTDGGRAYLRQAPHGWHFAADLPAGDALTGVPIDKDFKKAGENRRRLTAPRTLELTGDMRYKSVLDQGLLRDDRFEWGDLTLTAEQVWSQAPRLDKGRFVLRAAPTKLNLYLTVPVTETPAAETEVPVSVDGFLDRFVSIDLGERSLGYAVYDCTTATLLEAPATPVQLPQIAALIATARRYGATPARCQKFSARFDTRMEKARRNVVGDVVRKINEICARHRAFPVLESVAGGHGVDPQVALVYEAVLNHYLFSGVQERKRARNRFWYGGDSVQHPFLKVRRVETTGAGSKEKEKVTIAPLNLFPGAGVGPKGTSQRDSYCGRNAYEILDAIKDNRVFSSKDGQITLSDGLELYLERRGAKGMYGPIPDGTYKLVELRQLMRLSMRRPQPRKFGAGLREGRDTTMSWYKCVFADCRHEMHADQNAAINIGWKFLDQKIARDN